MSRRFQLTFAARADLSEILDYSADVFGIMARRRYEALFVVAFIDLQTDAVCVGSLDRPELGEAIRTYHLRSCRGRAKIEGASVGQPRHLIVYEYDDERVLVLRVLHDSMELAQHIPGD